MNIPSKEEPKSILNFVESVPFLVNIQQYKFTFPEVCDNAAVFPRANVVS